MEQGNQGSEGDCCAGLFLAEAADGRPGELLLECCMCGRMWQLQRDGQMVAVWGRRTTRSSFGGRASVGLSESSRRGSSSR